jgi:hypothetical protein
VGEDTENNFTFVIASYQIKFKKMKYLRLMLVCKAEAEKFLMEIKKKT